MHDSEESKCRWKYWIFCVFFFSKKVYWGSLFPLVIVLSLFLYFFYACTESAGEVKEWHGLQRVLKEIGERSIRGRGVKKTWWTKNCSGMIAKFTVCKCRLSHLSPNIDHFDSAKKGKRIQKKRETKSVDILITIIVQSHI